MQNSRFDKLLIPYLEGSLDAHRRAQIEEAIANDPRLAQEVEDMRRLKYQLERSAANFTSSTSNRSAWPGVQARIQAQPPSYFKISSFWGLGLTIGAAASLVVYFGVPHMAGIAPRGMTAANATLHGANAPNTHVGAPLVASIDGNANVLSSPLLSQIPVNIGFGSAPASNNQSMPAKITPPAILPAGPRHVGVANLVQVASADILPEVYVHPAVLGMASYNAAVVAPVASPDAATAPKLQSTAAPLSNSLTSYNGYKSPVQSSESVSTPGVPANSAPVLNASAPVHLATMSAVTDAAAPASGESPLMDTLRSVDDQADEDAANGLQSRALARWQSVLQATSSSSVFGDDSAQLLSMQTLQEIQAAGLLDAMRQELEDWQEQDQNNIGVRRMLADLYSVQGEEALALDQRRKAAALSTAIGEDWFQLGQSEESAGNLNSANTDYNKALQAGDLTNVMHANYARQRLPQSDS